VTVSTLGDDGSKGALALGDRCQSHTWDSAAVDEQEPVEVDAKSVEMPKAFKPEVEAASSSGVPGYNAEFLKDTVEDGTIMKPGNVFSQTWTLVNNGHAAWPVGCDVRYVGGDAMFDVDTSHPSDTMSLYSAQQSNKLFAPVEPGQSADFTVNLRAPEREGNVTSYWRLKLPNGMAVGHSLWCEIEVQEPVPAMAEESPVSEIGGSGMIFPKLEKESPESSTIQEAPAPVAPTLSNSSEVDVEDVESLALDDASTDAGFLTDEEYDVLDASDQEYLEAKQSAN
jgi:next-to-BRCA1 protein 1